MLLFSQEERVDSFDRKVIDVFPVGTNIVNEERYGIGTIAKKIIESLNGKF